ncbi:hypothetical protein N7457_005459 [Penicillium paradoxum]|uniref:uncharacterized protein n=1 Tax=Penicillium paradoxum TaxID=176176 RepID=UPI00254785D3|nr:uncharacterized protein N7457_005459 [Penicillium paradoxum]KAJ5780299.1 hypothetical protein N7457_005459 [Penicillium paradoxum]
MSLHEISFKRAPGHIGTEGNELADKLANQGALHVAQGLGSQDEPTISGIRSVYRSLRDEARFA